MTDALDAVLRERYGAGVWLGHWSARLLRKTLNRCVVLFDIFFRMPGAAKFDLHRWVGKFHEQTAVAARIATNLRALAATDILYWTLCGGPSNNCRPGIPTWSPYW